MVRIALGLLKLALWVRNLIKAYHANADEHHGAIIQQQQDQITSYANQLSAVKDMRKIQESNAAKPDGIVLDELRAESAAREPDA